MIPYPGESLGIFYGYDVTAADDTLGGDVSYRAGSRTLAAGTEWRAWVGSGTDYLDDPADCDGTPAWVVEVASGSVTVTASEGEDPSYGNPAAAAPTALGTFTLTAGTNVIPSAFTVADVWGYASSMMLRLVATSGSAVISQVKMRLWPAAGVGGGWSSTAPGWSTTPVSVTPRGVAHDFYGEASASTYEDAWAGAAAALAADIAANSGATSRSFGTAAVGLGGSVTQDVGLIDLTPTYSAGFRVWAEQTIITRASAAGLNPIDQSTYVEGVDWIRPPAEVPGDFDSYAQQDGTTEAKWLDANVVVTDGANQDVEGRITVHAEAGDWPDEDPSGSGVAYSFAYDHGGTPLAAGSYPLPTGGSKILVRVSHQVASGAGSTYPGGGDLLLQEDSTASLSGVKTYVSFPPYRYWSPTAVVESVLRWWPRNDGLLATSPARIGQQSSYQSGRGGGYQ